MRRASIVAILPVIPLTTGIYPGKKRAMRSKTEVKRLAILRVLREAGRPLGSSRIAEQLIAMGHDISERTVRFHLLGTDRAGLTENLGRSGRAITERGLKELATVRAYEKVGFLSAKIDQMTYGMDFDPAKKAGTVVLNMSLIERGQLARAAPLMGRVFAAGYGMGQLLTLLPPGRQLGEVAVPDGSVGIGTVCSVTLSGVLVANGIPINSRFGGLLELRDYRPTRFVELISYDGTTLDPLEVFIRSVMTNYDGATKDGNGLIGTGFREVPTGSRDHVVDLAETMAEVGLGGLLMTGWPGQPLLEIPVSEGRLGFIVIGGLNPVAILAERGIHVRHTGALAGLIDYRELFHYQELEEQVRHLG